MKNRLLLPIIVIVVLLGGITGIVIHEHKKDTAPVAAVSATPLALATVQGVAGSTALQLLQAKYTVVTQSFSFGQEITGINGHMADSKHYWEFMVNGTDASVGADSYTAKTGDVITFKYASL